MPVQVAINGFGRTGRAFLRSAIERHADITVVAINDLADTHTLAQLLKYDSSYGRFPADVSEEAGAIVVDGHEIQVMSTADAQDLPWGHLGVEVVIESTGHLRTRSAAAQHLQAGASKVIISAPAQGAEPPDATVVLGVNFDEVYDVERHHIISNASCTTNCLAPVAKVIQDSIGIKYGLMTTVHSYTGDQMLLDGPHKDARRARSAAINIVPTSTGAAKALGLVIPSLEGKLNGFALRVPTPTGSLVDLTVGTERPTSREEVNSIFAETADQGAMLGILAYTTDPIVSSDIVGSPYSSIFDSGLTSIEEGEGETLLKVIAWYDNEYGYSSRLVDLAQRVLVPVSVGV